MARSTAATVRSEAVRKGAPTLRLSRGLGSASTTISTDTVAGSPAASNIGQFVYAGGGANAGKGVLTPPTTSGARVQIVGVLHSHNGGPGGIATVKLQPQFLYDVP